MPEGEAAPTPHGGESGLANRQRIFDFVRRQPGAHLREIQRGLGIPYGTAEYHLHVMEEAQVVRTSTDGNLKRYFAADFPFADRTVVGLLRKRPVRRIVLALLDAGELAHNDLAVAAKVRPPTLSYHLPKLAAANLVAIRKDGRFTRVSLVDAKHAARLLVMHGRGLGDIAVDRFIETWTPFSAPLDGPENPPDTSTAEKAPPGKAGDEAKGGALAPPPGGPEASVDGAAAPDERKQAGRVDLPRPSGGLPGWGVWGAPAVSMARGQPPRGSARFEKGRRR